MESRLTLKGSLGIMLIAFISVVVNSQTLELGVISNPNYSFRTLNVKKGSTIKPEGEVAILGYDLGFLIITDLPRNNILLESGLVFSRMGFSYGETFSINGSPSETQHRFNFLNIPLNVSIHWNKKKKFSLMSKFGFQNYWLLEEFLNNSEGGHLNLDNNETRKYHIGITSGFGFSVAFKDRFRVCFMPNVNYLPLSLSKADGSFSRHLYSIGSEIRVSYKFIKKATE